MCSRGKRNAKVFVHGCFIQTRRAISSKTPPGTNQTKIPEFQYKFIMKNILYNTLNNA